MNSCAPCLCDRGSWNAGDFHYERHETWRKRKSSIPVPNAVASAANGPGNARLAASGIRWSKRSSNRPRQTAFPPTGEASPRRRPCCHCRISMRSMFRVSNWGIGEFDRVLGGGLVPGGVVLIGGDPGDRKIDTPAADTCQSGPFQKRPVCQRRGIRFAGGPSGKTARPAGTESATAGGNPARKNSGNASGDQA